MICSFETRLDSKTDCTRDSGKGVHLTRGEGVRHSPSPVTSTVAHMIKFALKIFKLRLKHRKRKAITKEARGRPHLIKENRKRKVN